MSNNNKELVKLLTAALALVKGGESEASGSLEFPSVKAIKKMDADELSEVAKQFGLTVKPKTAASILTTVATAVADEDVDDEDDLKAALTAAGLDEDGTASDLKEFIEAAGTSEDSDDDDGDEAPKAKKSKKASADDDDDDTSSDDDGDEDSSSDDDDDDDAKPAKKSKKVKDEDDDGDDDSSSDDDGEDEEEIKKDIATHLDEYNEACEDKKLKLKKGSQLVEKCTDDDGNVVPWGQAYVKKSEACCCGLPLLEDESYKGEGAQGICAVTSKVWNIDTEDNTFTEVKKSKKGAAKSGKKSVSDDDDDND